VGRDLRGALQPFAEVAPLLRVTKAGVDCGALQSPQGRSQVLRDPSLIEVAKATSTSGSWGARNPPFAQRLQCLYDLHLSWRSRSTYQPWRHERRASQFLIFFNIRV